MARKFIYSVLVLAVLAVAGITVYLCVADSNASHHNTFGEGGVDDDERAEVQSILVSYESDRTAFTDKCKKYIAERASNAVERRRRRLANADDAAVAALDILAHTIVKSLKGLKSDDQSYTASSAVTFDLDIEERADAAALELVMADEQQASSEQSSPAKLIRSVVAPVIWSAIPSRQYSSESKEGEQSLTRPFLTARTQSTSSFDEDKLHVKTFGVQDSNSSPEGELVAVSRWLKHVDLDVVRLLEGSDVYEVIAVANDTPCVYNVEPDTLIPIDDPPVVESSTMVRSAGRRRLFGFTDLLNEAKSAASSVGDWLASTVPDDVKETAKEAADTVGTWFKENLSQEAIKEQASKVSNWANDNIAPLYEDTKDAFKSLGERLTPHLKTAWDSLVSTGDKAKDEITRAIENAKKQFENDLELKAALNEIEETARSSIVDWERDMAETLEKISSELNETMSDNSTDQQSSDVSVDTVLGSGIHDLGTLLVETEQQVNALIEEAKNRKGTMPKNTRGANIPPQSFSMEESDDNDEQTLTHEESGGVGVDTDSLMGDGGHISAAQRRRRLQQDNSALLQAVFGLGTLDEVAGTPAETLLGLSTGRQPVAAHSERSVPNDALFSKQWSLGIIDAATAYFLSDRANSGRSEVILGVLDTGCDINHEDLKNRLWKNPGEICDDGIDNDENGYIDDCYGFNFYDHNNDLVEEKAHGSSVAGAALAETGNGVGIASACTHCKLMCLRVGKKGFNTAAFAEAVNYLLNYDVPVINYSGNGGRSENQVQALIKAAERDITIVLSAGNSNCNLDGTDTCTKSGYPAILPNENLIVVGASNDKNNSAYYSSYGKNKVHVHAPAGDLLPRPNNDYATVLGTSFSAPTVAGLAGLIRHAYPTLTTKEVKQAIIQSCYPHSSLSTMNACGGIVDFAAALTAASKLANNPL